MPWPRCRRARCRFRKSRRFKAPMVSAPSADRSHAAFRSRAAQHRRRLAVRQRGRADERHRLARVREARPRGRLHRSGGSRAPAGRERRPDHRRQHGRGDARLEGGDGEVPEPDRRRTRHRARARDDRLVEVGRDRGGTEMRPGQGRRQLDLDEGGRGRVPAPGQARQALRRRGDRDGLRRKGPGRHVRAQGRDLPAGLRPADAARRRSRPRT